MNILVVDDDPIVIQSCCRILESENHSVRSADSVASGEILLNEQDFDLMVTDIKMPGQDGFEMIRRARSMNPHLPVIVMTGYLMPEMVKDIRSMGVNYFIPKPFKPSEFLEVVYKATGP